MRRVLFTLFLWSLWAVDLRAEPVCAKVATTLRKAPSAQAPVSWKVAKNMPFLRFERKAGWDKVQDLDGEVHWARPNDLTTRFRCVVVKSNVAALHRDPDSKAPASDLRSLDRYTPLKRIGDNREWIQIEDESGRQAWIHESQIWKPVTVNSFSF